MMNVHDTRCRTRCLAAIAVALFASAASACARPEPRPPIAMVKIDPSPVASGAPEIGPLSKSTDIPATSSANDLASSGPKVSEPPVERKSEPRFADPQNSVQLTKHSDVPVGGNMHGYNNETGVSRRSPTDW